MKMKMKNENDTFLHDDKMIRFAKVFKPVQCKNILRNANQFNAKHSTGTNVFYLGMDFTFGFTGES